MIKIHNMIPISKVAHLHLPISRYHLVSVNLHIAASPLQPTHLIPLLQATWWPLVGVAKLTDPAVLVVCLRLWMMRRVNSEWWSMLMLRLWYIWMWLLCGLPEIFKTDVPVAHCFGLNGDGTIVEWVLLICSGSVIVILCCKLVSVDGLVGERFASWLGQLAAGGSEGMSGVEIQGREGLSCLSSCLSLPPMHVIHISQILHARNAHPLLRLVKQWFQDNFTHILAESWLEHTLYELRVIFYLLHELLDVSAAIRSAAMEHLVKDHSHRPTVTFLAIESAQQCLRCHIRGRTNIKCSYYASS